ncbi:hypothetical protein B7P43_G09716 [Cryptotermes secundus]|uniref:Single domain-containing protein n=1 Tax=Cryptotermes secundus TaxID=105785 RepID=A0A2J7PVP1_9NEOP|nr:hypothetical protein B7P43_G09716 [Cryptotermes secundus]
MKHTMLHVVLAICIITATSALGCSPPLNCTGVFHCPLILSGPGVVIESGTKYCSCCPVSITYLDENEPCTDEGSLPNLRLCREPLVCKGTCVPPQ